jgi:glycosyltransferase involved in cell wall biosynthesis
MKILMQARVNLYTAPGGDTIQILKTREHLERMGIQCDVSVTPVQDYGPYDLIHLFNYTRIQETYWFAREAKKWGKFVVLSTVYWDNEETERMADLGWRKYLTKRLNLDQIERLKGTWRLVGERQLNRANLNLVMKGFLRLQKEAIQYIDHFLPNSEGEMALFQTRFGQKATLPYTVVPNGVDPELLFEGPGNWDSDLKDCVICVARIDGRKNQLNLAKALRGSSFPLVFVGQPAPNHASYMEKLRDECGPSCYFLGQLPNKEVYRLYGIAKVHCLPSWYETPGLASLEAAAVGCNIVITDRGSTREYFGDYAYYCEPDSVESIREAVFRAYHAPKNEALKRHVLGNFTWAKAAEKTAVAYERVITRARAS